MGKLYLYFLIAAALNWKLDNVLENWYLMIGKSSRQAMYTDEIANRIQPGYIEQQ